MAEAAWSGRRLHFVGAGGAGMSGLALLARALGAEVDGCDRSLSAYGELLAREGIEVAPAHAVEHARQGVELVVSTAIPDDTAELIAAREMGLKIVHRSELLAEVAALRRTVAVSGTHGKTTTSAMIAHCLTLAGGDPGYAIGAELRGDGNAGVHAHWGAGEWFVVEADESDRSFLRFKPAIAVITNLELDHHTTYRSEIEFERAFAEFAEQVGDDGTVIASEQAAGRLGATKRELVVFGSGEGAALRATGVEHDLEGTTFTLNDANGALATVRLPLHGAHNVENALAALATCVAVGIEPAAAASALRSFRSAGRRFELVGERAGALIYDDYAHHPTEVAATLRAARELQPRRLLAAFQPHLYSRTLHLHSEFGRALALADEVVVLDVYAARERPQGGLSGVSGKLVVDAVADSAPGRQLWWLPTIDEADRVLAPRLGEGDLLVTLGAGDIDSLARRLAGVV